MDGSREVVEELLGEETFKPTISLLTSTLKSISHKDS